VSQANKGLQLKEVVQKNYWKIFFICEIETEGKFKYLKFLNLILTSKRVKDSAILARLCKPANLAEYSSVETLGQSLAIYKQSLIETHIEQVQAEEI